MESPSRSQKEVYVEKLQRMSLVTLCEVAGCAEDVASTIEKAGGGTHSLVSVASIGNLQWFVTSVQGLLKDKGEVREWDLTCLYGYLQSLLKEAPVVHASPMAAPDKDDDSELMKLRAELGFKSQSRSMATLKALCTDVGPDGIDINDKVTKAIMEVRKGKTSGLELVMQVSGCGEVLPKMTAGLGTRKALWSLARKNWNGLMVFAKKVKRILVRVGGDAEGEEAAQTWEFFLEYLSDLAEIKGERFAGEYFVSFTSEYDFTFQDGEGKPRLPSDDRIKMLTQRLLKSSIVDSDDDEEVVRPRPKKKLPLKKSDGPCLKCGQGHGVFQCSQRCKTSGHCVICGKKRDICTDMFSCEERHADSK